MGKVLCVLAVWTIRAEAGKVALTRRVAYMLVTTRRAVLAEAARIPRTLSHLARRIDVQVETLWVAALAILCEKPALGHFLQVVLMQELAVFALLTQPAEPVLADNRFFGPAVLE